MDIPYINNPELEWWATVFFLILSGALAAWQMSSKLTAKMNVLLRGMETVGKDAKAAKHQVQNDHGTNLRHDIDDLTTLASETAGKLDLLLKEQARQGAKQEAMEKMLDRGLDEHGEFHKDIGGIRDELRRERARTDRLYEQVSTTRIDRVQVITKD